MNTASKVEHCITFWNNKSKRFRGYLQEKLAQAGIHINKGENDGKSLVEFAVLIHTEMYV